MEKIENIEEMEKFFYEKCSDDDRFIIVKDAICELKDGRKLEDEINGIVNDFENNVLSVTKSREVDFVDLCDGVKKLNGEYETKLRDMEITIEWFVYDVEKTGSDLERGIELLRKVTDFGGFINKVKYEVIEKNKVRVVFSAISSNYMVDYMRKDIDLFRNIGYAYAVSTYGKEYNFKGKDTNDFALELIEDNESRYGKYLGNILYFSEVFNGSISKIYDNEFLVSTMGYLYKSRNPWLIEENVKKTEFFRAIETMVVSLDLLPKVVKEENLMKRLKDEFDIDEDKLYEIGYFVLNTMIGVLGKAMSYVDIKITTEYGEGGELIFE